MSDIMTYVSARHFRSRFVSSVSVSIPPDIMQPWLFEPIPAYIRPAVARPFSNSRAAAQSIRCLNDISFRQVPMYCRCSPVHSDRAPAVCPNTSEA